MRLQGKQIADSTITQNKLNLITPVLDLDAATKQYVDLLQSVEHLNLSNKDMVAISTTGLTGVVIACETPILETPVSSSYVTVSINKIPVDVGIGKGCYFSNNSGVTAKASGEEALGDILYWDTALAPYDLETIDRIDFIYVKSGTSTEDGEIDGGEV